MSIFRESLSGLASSQIPKSKSSVPRWRQKIVVVVSEGEVADEVRVSSEWLDWDSEVWNNFRLVVEFPDENGSVSRSSDEDLSVFIFLLGVSSFDSSNPVGVTF